MKREAMIATMNRKEWRAMYHEWRKPYAHLPPEVRGLAVRGCAGKIAYETEAEAMKVANKLPPRPPKRIGCYPCIICKKFHIGNSAYPANHRIFTMPPTQEKA